MVAKSAFLAVVPIFRPGNSKKGEQFLTEMGFRHALGGQVWWVFFMLETTQATCDYLESLSNFQLVIPWLFQSE